MCIYQKNELKLVVCLVCDTKFCFNGMAKEELQIGFVSIGMWKTKKCVFVVCMEGPLLGFTEIPLNTQIGVGTHGWAIGTCVRVKEFKSYCDCFFKVGSSLF